MKRTAYLLLRGFLVATLLFFTVIPHHHHENVCVVGDPCVPSAQSGTSSPHHSPSHESDGGQSCQNHVVTLRIDERETWASQWAKGIGKGEVFGKSLFCAFDDAGDPLAPLHRSIALPLLSCFGAQSLRAPPCASEHKA
ncbi:hypothetical protein EII14_08805 [Alloprevotella sp. OH1205_COT-284]|uniref:hypothetical protein n=1 Tax=Alloprevotella sp. OH1205_COT-284 TaxID=2491043 RepID=UPI000F5D87B9|nr:hypothetical protein [Alloprevotella sp. OH1205_COT-284]RRD75011.1 hypothetical protein EII14_08805 [Alloprevotella sp. OH1205_COT-284]